MAGRKGGKWDWMRAVYKNLGLDPDYQMVVNATKEPHLGKTLDELAASANDLEDRKAIATMTLEAINAELTGVEQLMLDAFEKLETVDSIRVNGYTFKPQTSPSPRIADPVQFRAWVDNNSPHILSVNAQTLKGIVSRALEGDGAIPDGLEIKQHTSISRRK